MLGLELTEKPNLLLSRKYFNPGDKIIVGLSGGPDSVCLAYLLNQLRSELNLQLYLVHINYMLRGVESNGDQKFCEAFAQSYNLPLYVEIQDMSAYQSKPENIQTKAREYRMTAFNTKLRELNFDKIALGHTRDDNVETVLGNIIRGCGLDGLSGLEEKSGRIIRPLLTASKAGILDFLHENKIEYRVDSSNLKNEYTRNKIRNQLIPSIKDNYNPRFDEAIIRLSKIAGESSEYLHDSAVWFIEQSVKYSEMGTALIPLEALRNTHPALARAVIRKITEQISLIDRGSVSYDMIDKTLQLLDSETGTKTDLGAHTVCERGRDDLLIYMDNVNSYEYKPQIPGKTDLPECGLVLHSSIENSDRKINFSEDNKTVYLDFAKLSDDFSVRNYRKGDRFQPLGLNGSKKLGDFFTDRGVPERLRQETPLVVCGGEIVWVAGMAISEKYKLEPSTKTILKLWIEKLVKKAE